jgi:HK97 family phage prohead protease
MNVRKAIRKLEQEQFAELHLREVTNWKRAKEIDQEISELRRSAQVEIHVPCLADLRATITSAGLVAGDGAEKFCKRWRGVFDALADRTGEQRLAHAPTGKVAIERRFLPTQAALIQMKVRGDGARTIAGYAAVYYDAGDPGTEYMLTLTLVERLMPGCFDRALRESHDCRGLFNHDPNWLLGRTASGTCRLSTDRKGLRYEIDLPKTTQGADVAEMIRRGDLTGSSFAFAVTKQSFIYKKDSDWNIRQIEDVDLMDVSPVTFPAYQSATTGLQPSRAAGSAKPSLRASDFKAMRRRLAKAEAL